MVFFQVNVCGMMHFWGLTIDTLTSILLILSIGLAIDYSAHVGHTFMTVAGSRNGKCPPISLSLHLFAHHSICSPDKLNIYRLNM